MDIIGTAYKLKEMSHNRVCGSFVSYMYNTIFGTFEIMLVSIRKFHLLNFCLPISIIIILLLYYL